MPSSAVEALLKTHTSLGYDESKNKVVCQFTKHEMPAVVSAIESYVQGKKYRKAAEKSFDYDQHKPHIVPSSKKKHLHELFCTLTLRHLAKTPLAVARHVNGKRYKRALVRWTRCQETGEKFVPRIGGRQRSKPSDSDSIASGGGGNHWSDDSMNEADSDDDDLEDLYPAEIFGAEGDADEDSKEDADEEAEENTPPAHLQQKKSQTTHEGPDDEGSDYDMSVLDNDGDTATNNTSSQQPSATNHKKSGKKKGKKVKKMNREAAEATGQQAKDQDQLANGKGGKRKSTSDIEGLKKKKKKQSKNT